MREGPLIERSCRGCRYHDVQYYRVQGDSGYDHYCTHGGGKRDTGSYDGKTPDWCPFMQPASAQETAVDLDPTQFRREVAGKQAYLDSQDDSIHCNRYPAWHELTQEQRDEWIERAAANRGV